MDGFSEALQQMGIHPSGRPLLPGEERGAAPDGAAQPEGGNPVAPVLERIQEIADPGERGHQLTEFIDNLEVARKLAIRMRRGAIAEMLHAGKKPTEIGRTVGLSASSVKIVQQSLNM